MIIKHFKRCKPDCSGNKCEDGCGKKCSKCKTGCDKHGKCKPTAVPVPTPTVASTSSTWNDELTKRTHKHKIKTLLSKSSNSANVNGAITDTVLSCVLAKIINIYKKPKDFDDALSNPNILTVLIKIVNDCINGTTTDPTQRPPTHRPTHHPTHHPTHRPTPTIDPSKVCDPKCNSEESCIKKGCVPRTWTREFYNKFRDSMMSDPDLIQKGGSPISKHIANCITDSFKNKYNNPQKMINDLDPEVNGPGALTKLLKNFYAQCTPQPPPNPCGITISDSCKSKGQNKVNRGFLGCDDEIVECEGGAGGTMTDDCLDSLRDIASYTCDNMIRHKPGRHDDDDRDKGWYYCNAAVPDSTNPYAPPCGSCMFVADRSQVPAGHPTAPGVLDADGSLNCDVVNFCADSMDCNLPITSGIY